MAQFDVYRNNNKNSNQNVPFFLDVQAEVLQPLIIHAVVPLLILTELKEPIRYLNPKFTIEKKHVIMSTAEIAGIPIKIFGEKVSSLKEYRDQIIAALDFLFTGF